MPEGPRRIIEGTRRFIAGAVCPACGGLDKIYVVTEGDVLHRRCSRCDFEESLRKSEENVPVTGEWQTVKLKDPRDPR